MVRRKPRKPRPFEIVMDEAPGDRAQQGDMEIAIHPNLPDLYRRKVARLQRLLDDEAMRPQAVEITARLLIGSKSTPAKSVATARSLLSVR